VTIWQFEAAFWLALVAALMHGTSAAFSESTMLGFMKGFPSRLVAPFSAGTGFAGIFGSGILLVLKIWFERDGYIFAVVSPIIIVYLVCIYWLQRQKDTYRFDRHVDALTEQMTSRSLKNDTVDPFISPLSKTLSGPLGSGKIESRTIDLETPVQSEEIVLEYEVEKREDEEDDNGDNPKTSLKKNTSDNPDDDDFSESGENAAFSIPAVKRVFKHVGVFLFSLAMIYFFEYTVLTCFADVFTKRKRAAVEGEPNFLEQNSYIILTVCYQFGVLISRGSLDCFKVKKLWILIITQIINFVLWFLNVYFWVVTHYAAAFAHIALVGMMGGTLYVNVLYSIVSSKSLDFNDKELAMIMCTIFDDLGILSASIVSLILNNTIFHKYQTLENGAENWILPTGLAMYYLFKASRK
jgi:hypothetical protein